MRTIRRSSFLGSRTGLIAAALGLTLVVAACSSSSDSAEDGTTASQPTSESSAPANDESSSDESEPTEEPEAEEGDGSAPTMDPHSVSIIANWLPQASQGGYWQAAAEGLGQDDGVTIEMKSGGPGIQTVTNVAIGDADYGMTAVDNIYVARAQGIPIVGVFAPLDGSEQCLMSHPEANVKDFTDLNGKNLSVAPAGSYWKYIQAKYDIQPASEMPPVSMANWQEDPNMVLQCFYGAEAYTAQENGLEANFLMISESGYNPYTQVLFTTENRLRDHADEVAAVVKAVATGWDHFLNGQEGPGVDLILSQNPDYSKDAAMFDVNIMADMQTSPMGTMDPQRWKETYDALVSVELITDKIAWEDGFSTDFLSSP